MGGIIELARPLADRDAPAFGEAHPHDEATELRQDFGHHQLMRSDEQFTCLRRVSVAAAAAGEQGRHRQARHPGHFV